jgi:hypothetical protein
MAIVYDLFSDKHISTGLEPTLQNVSGLSVPWASTQGQMTARNPPPACTALPYFFGKRELDSRTVAGKLKITALATQIARPSKYEGFWSRCDTLY